MSDPISLDSIAARARQQAIILDFLRSRGIEWTRLSSLVKVRTPFGDIGEPYDDLRVLERAGLIEIERRVQQVPGKRKPVRADRYRAAVPGGEVLAGPLTPPSA